MQHWKQLNKSRFPVEKQAAPKKPFRFNTTRAQMALAFAIQPRGLEFTHLPFFI